MTYYLCGVCGLVHNSLTDPPCPVPIDAILKTPPSPPPQPPPPPIPVDPQMWIEELRERCAKAGYSEVHIGRCNIIAMWTTNGTEPRVRYHRGCGSDVPALWCIFHDLVGHYAVGWGGNQKHSVGFNAGLMSKEHRAKLDAASECARVCEKFNR